MPLYQISLCTINTIYIPVLTGLKYSIPHLPPQETLGPYANKPTNETQTVVEFIAVRAGKSVLSFSYVGNDTNETVFKKYAHALVMHRLLSLLFLHICTYITVCDFGPLCTVCHPASTM